MSGKLLTAARQIKRELIAHPQSPGREQATEDLKNDQDQTAKLKSDEEGITEKARELEAEVDLAGRRADRYDLGEALLEIALVTTSITLLTNRRAFWYSGLVIGLCGILAAASGFLLR